MKKIEYMTPDMEVIKMTMKQHLLDGSTPGEETPGTGNVDEF